VNLGQPVSPGSSSTCSGQEPLGINGMVFSRAGCPSCHLAVNNEALWGAQSATNSNRWPDLMLSSSNTICWWKGCCFSAKMHVYNYIIIILLLVVPLSWTWCLFFCLSICLYFCREDYWAESYEQIYVKFLGLSLQQETVRCCRWSGFGSSSSFGPLYLASHIAALVP